MSFLVLGMFPYVMIAVMPIFCEADWPKRFLSKNSKLQSLLLYDSPPGINDACVYSDEDSTKTDNESVSIFLPNSLAYTIFMGRKQSCLVNLVFSIRNQPLDTVESGYPV